MLFWLQLFVIFIQVLLVALVGYLMLLTAVSWRAPRHTKQRESKPTNRFLILVPAHNEERLLPTLLANLYQVDYPKDLYAVHVVADNCTDNTASIVQQNGAHVHERFNSELRGKGYALQWLLQRLWQAAEPHDAILILDADSSISANFLRVMDARLAQGERVIQSYYAVRDPEQSWSISLRYVALALLHYLRPLGRMILGGSTGLKGNGMVFAADILKKHEWSASITEDIEFHMALVLDGERVMFAPDAIVEAEMPHDLADSQTQNTRWERGRLQMAQTYVPQLLKASWKAVRAGEYGRAYLLFDAVMEHIIPPFSILAGLTGLGFLAALILFIFDPMHRQNIGTINLILGSVNIIGQIIYIFYGLHLVQAPRQIYKALLYAPGFVFWKIWLYIRILLGRDKDGWVRTARNQT
ncbi:MAG: glycosyltransferase family 2 protein [Ardenticatenaceae bacterium]|nr:glycosyltransferase family 2 protein [Ardenticatenaceae bacterium]MCB9442654.1 glycosyltransferase family 2 protein [Ardenticatenaceae bacterium]